MADVISISFLTVDAHGHCTVEAFVDDIVVVAQQTHLDPAEYGPALCRGTFYLCDDEVMPVDEQSQLDFIADRVNYWEVLDTTDD